MKYKISFFVLLLLNLACASSAFNVAMTRTPTPFYVATSTTTQTTTPALCAVVVAVKSLNVRETANGAVIDYLKHDDVVQVIDNQGEWWKVQTDSSVGFAHSAYLQITECVK